MCHYISFPLLCFTRSSQGAGGRIFRFLAVFGSLGFVVWAQS